MSLLDDARKKLGQAVDQHGGTISAGIDKAAAAADERTGGKHRSAIQGITGKAKDALARLDSKDDQR